MPQDPRLAAKPARCALLSLRRVPQPLPPPQPALLPQCAGSVTAPTALGQSVGRTAGLPWAKRCPEGLGQRGEGGRVGVARAVAAPSVGVPAASCQKAPLGQPRRLFPGLLGGKSGPLGA